MVSFSVRNLGLTVQGRFTDFTGSFEFDKHHPEKSHFQSTVKTASLETGISLRDKHLKKEEYLSIDNFPEMMFKSKSVSRSSDNKFKMVGTLVIKDKEKEISFPFKATSTKGGYHFEGEFKIDRRDFGVGGNSLTISDDVTIRLGFRCERK